MVADALHSVPGHEGLHCSSVNRWKSGMGRVPVTAVEPLAKFLTLDSKYSSVSEIEKQGSYWSDPDESSSPGGRSSVQQPAARTFETALNGMHWRGIQSREESKQSLISLFDTMGANHFVVVTTQTQPPAAFREKEYTKDVVEAVYRAMDRGTLVGYIVPTAARFDSLRRYGFDKGLTSNKAFRNDFNRFSVNYERRLKEAGEKEPKRQTGELTQLFEWADFPLSPCGRVISLFGEAGTYGQRNNRVIERGTITGGEPWLVPKNEQEVARLEKFIEFVIQDDTASKHAERSKVEQTARALFIKHLIDRMYGYPKGYAIADD